MFFKTKKEKYIFVRFSSSILHKSECFIVKDIEGIVMNEFHYIFTRLSDYRLYLP